MNYNKDYNKLAAIMQDKTMPVSAENEDKEYVLIEKAYSEEEGVYFIVTTFQHNDWCRINEYYADGTVTEYFEK